MVDCSARYLLRRSSFGLVKRLVMRIRLSSIVAYTKEVEEKAEDKTKEEACYLGRHAWELAKEPVSRQCIDRSDHVIFKNKVKIAELIGLFVKRLSIFINLHMN